MPPIPMSVLDIFPSTPRVGMDIDFSNQLVPGARSTEEGLKKNRKHGIDIIEVQWIALTSQFSDSMSLVPVKFDSITEKELFDRIFISPGDISLRIGLIDPNPIYFTERIPGVSDNDYFICRLRFLTNNDCDAYLIGETSDQALQTEIDKQMVHAARMGIIAVQVTNLMP